MGLSPLEARIVGGLDDHQADLEALLGRLVGISSESMDAAGTNQVADLVASELEELGFRTSELVTGVVGRTVVGRRVNDDSHRLLLVGHGDTVHPRDGGFSGYQVLDDSRATGPGAADMKGGLVVMLAGLRALRDAGALEGRHCTVVVNADEEIGSPHSADLIRAEAAESQLCLGFEAGRPLSNGASTFVTQRRGFGRMRLVAKGRAAHAGVEPEKGASALLELCRKAVELEELTDTDSGVSVNVGVLRGGSAANVVAAEAELHLDYRFPDEEAGETLEEAIFDIAARNLLRDGGGQPCISTVMQEHVRRAAMERTDATDRMSARIVTWGRDLGLVLEEEARGGSSDAALAPEMGCPAVCGLGVVGDAFHTHDEWIRRASLVDRGKLAALLAHRFFEL